MKQTPELSIIIINFNTSSLTQQCLQSLAAAKKKTDEWEVIVVDNGSIDGSPTELPIFIENHPQLKSYTTYLHSEKNLGFSGGNNVGIKAAKGNTILLLNSDTEVYPDAIQTVLKELNNDKKAGAATCKLILPNGAIDPACHRGFPTPWAAITYFLGLERLFPHSRWFAQYHLGYLDSNKPHTIDALSGAFFMIKRLVIAKIGLLDEQFFMYGEDLDWAYRIGQAGYTILFLPQISVLHKKKQSGRQSKNTEIKTKTTVSFYQTMQLFYRKHYQKKYPVWMTWGIMRLLDLRIWLTRHSDV